MSSPYPPQPPPRKLERSRSNRVFGGVCAGVANYLNMDVNLVRVLTVVVSLFTGFPVVLYIVALFLIPEEKPEPYVGPETVHVPTSDTGPATGSATGPSDPVWGSSGAPWETSSPAGPPPGPPPAPSPGPSPASDASPSPESPASAAPEGSGVADPEPVPERSTPEPTVEETSSWESAPADPEQGSPKTSGETPPSEGHKPAS